MNAVTEGGNLGFSIQIGHINEVCCRKQHWRRKIAIQLLMWVYTYQCNVQVVGLYHRQLCSTEDTVAAAALQFMINRKGPRKPVRKK